MKFEQKTNKMLKKKQKVVCVDGKFHPESIKLIENRPVENNVYTVRDCFMQKGQMVVLLEEIINKPLNMSNETTTDGGYGFSFEPNFKASRFVPLDELFDKEIESLVNEIEFV